MAAGSEDEIFETAVLGRPSAVVASIPQRSTLAGSTAACPKWISIRPLS